MTRPGSSSGLKKMPGMFSFSEKQKWVALSVVQTLVVLAAGLWPVFFKETHLRLMIHHTRVPEELIVMPSSPKTVEILVSGLKFRIHEAKKKEVLYTLDLSSSRPGVNTVPFHIQDVHLPKGLKVIRSSSSSLSVKLDYRIRKRLPVHVVLSGKPGTGFEITTAEAEPSKAWFQGPKTLLESMVEVKTKPLDIGNIDESIRKNVVLDLPEGIVPLDLETPVSVGVSVKEKIILKTLKNLPVQGRDAKYDFTLIPSTISLKVKGSYRALDQPALETGIDVFVDLSGSGPGEHERYATIQLPVPLVLVDATPEWFRVKIHPTLKNNEKKEANRAAGR
jgi:YbbR domain-containing protein